MPRSNRTRLLRATGAALTITAASFTTVACGSDTVNDNVQRNVEEGVDEAEQKVEDATNGGDGDG